MCRKVLPALSSHTPLLPGADAIAYVDVDDTIRHTYGYAKQGVGIGYSKVKGLNALIAVVSTPLPRPVIVAARLRRGATNSAHNAGSFVAEAIKTARSADATGMVVVRADSAFHAEQIVAAARGLSTYFSVTVRMNASIRAAISNIDDNAWTPIRYPQGVAPAPMMIYPSPHHVVDRPHRWQGIAGVEDSAQPHPAQQCQALVRIQRDQPGFRRAGATLRWIGGIWHHRASHPCPLRGNQGKRSTGPRCTADETSFTQPAAFGAQVIEKAIPCDSAVTTSQRRVPVRVPRRRPTILSVPSRFA